MFGRKENNNKNVFMENECSFDFNSIYDVLRQKGIDNKYLKDKEFVEDLINFGYEAAVKIKLVKEEKVENK